VARPILFGRSEAEADAVRAAVPGMHEELRRLEEAVAGGRPLVGDGLSAADLVWYCAMAFLVRGATRPAAAAFDLQLLPIVERYPSIAAWARRIEAIPGFADTVPPHWKEGEAPFSSVSSAGS
jgi:glutathione S-transferase